MQCPMMSPVRSPAPPRAMTLRSQSEPVETPRARGSSATSASAGRREIGAAGVAGPPVEAPQ